MDNYIDLTKLKKAQSTFERFRIDMKTDRDQAGAVRAFEFCYELAWKMMKRFLALRGQETGSPKDTFRKSALEKLIDDPEMWFNFHAKRNLIVHTYELDNLSAIIEIFDIFSKELNSLIGRMENES